MHVQDVTQENVERRDPSTTRGRAITCFYVARRQGVKNAHDIKSTNFWGVMATFCGLLDPKHEDTAII